MFGVRLCAIAVAVLPIGAQAQDVLNVPSGLSVTFHEVIWNQPGQGLVYRFRFISPEIATRDYASDLEAMESDMAHLCQQYALPRIADTGPQPNQIVISLSDRPTKFGTPAPEATQFFEGYSIQDKNCIWEPF